MPRKIPSTIPSFGQRLTQLRNAKGLTQTELGEAIGVSQRVIAYYEGETQFAPTNLLPKLCEILEVSADVLLGLEAMPKPDGRSVEVRFLRKWSQLEERDRRTVGQLVDSLLAK